MLEIITDGRELDIFPDTAINLTIENPFVLEDRIPVPYSFSFDLPPTLNNLGTFRHPERLGAYKSGWTFIALPCQIRFASITIAVGNLQMEKYTDRIVAKFQGVDYLENVRKKLFEIDFGRQYFSGSYQTVDFYNPNNFASAYASWAASAANGARPDFVLAPITIVNKNMPNTAYKPRAKVITYQRYELKRGFEVQDNELINMFNPINDSYFVTRFNSSETTNVAVSHSAAFPSFRVGFLFDKIFGDVLETNLFKTGDLHNLVMPTYYFPQWQERTVNLATPAPGGQNAHYPPMVSNPREGNLSPYPSQPFVEIKDFLPDVVSTEFVKSLLKMFCMTLVPVNGKLKMVQNKGILGGSAVRSWSGKLVGQLEFTNSERKTYVYGYENSEAYRPNENVVVAPSIYAMQTFPFDLEDGVYNQLFFIAPSRQFFSKIIQEVEMQDRFGNTIVEQQVSYELLGDGFHVAEQDDQTGSFLVKSSIRPAAMYPARFYPYQLLPQPGAPPESGARYYEVPGIQLSDRSVRPADISLAFYRGRKGMLTDASKTYPFLSPYSTSSNEVSLAWDGERGLIENYHKEFKEWVERDKLKTNGVYLLNAVDLHQLDLTQKIHVNGRDFFIEKIQITIRANTIDPAVVDMVEA